VQVGRYLLAAKLASGGMSSVHLGRLVGAAGFGRTVAIKQLHPHLALEREFVAMLLDEARLASRVRHQNVVSVSDVVQQDEQLLLVMEYVPGVSLAELVRLAQRDDRVLPLPVVSAIGCGILHGLHAAHEATDERGRALGIVHRDVSPQNVLVGSDGVARVVDFGVAKAVGRLNTTLSGQVKGKMAYMAPEQLRSGAVDRRADLYAAAMVLWEAITLGRPFGDETEAAFKRVSVDVPPPSSVVPGLPPALDEMLARALARVPEQRTSTALQMARELEEAVPPASAAQVAALVADLGGELLHERASMVSIVEGHPQPPLPAISHPEVAPAVVSASPRKRRPFLVGGLFVVLAGGAAAFLLRPRASEIPPPAAALSVAPDPLPVATTPPSPPAIPPEVAPEPAPPARAEPVRVTHRQHPGRSKRRRATSASQRRAGAENCVPPFTIGPDGVKQYKLECL
jgi:serine/threonine protein kinase